MRLLHARLLGGHFLHLSILLARLPVVHKLQSQAVAWLISRILRLFVPPRVSICLATRKTISPGQINGEKYRFDDSAFEAPLNIAKPIVSGGLDRPPPLWF